LEPPRLSFCSGLFFVVIVLLIEIIKKRAERENTVFNSEMTKNGKKKRGNDRN